MTHHQRVLKSSKSHHYLMNRKATRLSKLDASILEAHMRYGNEWPVGLVDAIREAHQTTIRKVLERKRILRNIESYKQI